MNKKYMSVSFIGAICFGLSGCQYDGGHAYDNGSEPTAHFGSSVGDNQGLSLEVKRALRDGALTSMLMIDVSTVSEGTVRLSGSVESLRARDDAERIAGKVDGVVFVVNSLSIR